MADQNRDDRADSAVNDAAARSESADVNAAGSGAAGQEAQDKPAAKPGGHVMVLPPSRDGGWNAAGAEAASGTGAPKAGKRRLSAMAAVFALAAVAGVAGGSLASAALGHLFGSRADPAAAQQVQALNATIGKLNAEVAALKTAADRAARADAAQLAKITDRVEKVEKAQVEPAAKLARLGEAVEKLRVAAATPAPAPAKDNARETTGSIPTPAAAAHRAAPEINRLPTVPGWRIRDIGNGGALIEGRGGLYEVYAGDPLPGLGRVDAIRKQDGRWVVVTSKGLIVGR